MTSTPSPWDLAGAAAAHIREMTGVEQHDIAVVLGSGWAECADRLGTTDTIIEMAVLPGFTAPTAMGHGHTVRSLTVAGHRVLCFLGRVHLYEGHTPDVVVHAVRTAAAAGCSRLVLTNAAGGLRREWPVGSAILVRDHLNFTTHSPLTGLEPPAPHGSRFCDLTHAYDPDLRRLVHSVRAGLPEGVYAGLTGPHFETPAEIGMLATLGADLVGMSSVLEVIAARHLDMHVLAISLVSNLAAGFTDQPLSADEVIEAADAAVPNLASLLVDILQHPDFIPSDQLDSDDRT